MARLVWLITGTSSGLDAELALAALKRGDKVISTAHAPISRIANLDEAGAITFELCVTWKETDVRATVFKPEFLHAANYVAPEHGDYVQVFEDFQKGEEAIYGHQVGGPTQCVERIVDVVRMEGFAAGKETPRSVPLGSEARRFIRKRAQNPMYTCDELQILSDTVDYKELIQQK